MKKHHSDLAYFDRKMKSISIFVKIPGIVLFLFFGFSLSVQSQVTFTQTTDADFNVGYLDNVLASGNNVYLANQATGINNWLSTNDLPQTLSGHKVARWKNYVYLSGGYNGTNFSNSVYRATMQSGGNSTWTSLEALPDSIQDHAMVASAEYLYVLGGRKNGLPFNKVYFAKINSNATLGSWTESSVTLPDGLWGHTAVYQNGFIYVVAGTNSNVENTALATVYFTKVTSIDGEIAPFSEAPSIPDSRAGHTMICYNDQLIVMGGYDNFGIKHNSLFYSSLDIDGTCSAWSTATSLPVNISEHGSSCNNGLLTVIGGEDDGGLSNTIYYANIDDLPSLTWTTAVDTLYEARKKGAAYTYNGQVIYAGGTNISASQLHNTRYALVSLGSEKIHKGSFMSYPFYQLGEERNIVSLSYNITYNETFNNYELLYRTAGSDKLWGSWVEMTQDNPALVGDYKQYIQYMVKFDGTEDGNIILHDMSVNISGLTQLSGNLNGIDTLKLENSPYWVTANISFTGGTHVVEAGVEILFSPNTGLEISQANMSFEGTEAEPITLTSYNIEAGLWNGVYFSTNSDNGVSSSLNYVNIEKAGAGDRNANLYCVSTNEPLINNSSFKLADGHGIRLNDADITIQATDISNNTENGIYNQNSSPSLSNTNLLNNGNAGLFLYDLTSSPNFFNCNITGNYYGVYYPSPNYSFPDVSGITSYSNIISGIAMAGGDITADQTWPYTPFGYAILGDIRIIKEDTHVRLTIAPGNTIYCDSLVQLAVGTYITYNNHYGGELYAVGKPDSLITFTSINGEPGGWDGLFFHYNSDSFESTSELNNCIIENGREYNIMCDGTLQPRIDSCIINNSAGMDIYVMDPNSVPHITSSTTNVYVDGGTQSIDKTWYNFGDGDYIVLNDIIIALEDDKARLTIQPGIDVKVDSAMIQVGHYITYNNHYGGDLYAEGTADSLITFTSLDGTVGGWDGIFFHYNSDSFGSTSSLKYCTIEKGNNFNIKSDGSAEPRIDMCTINNSNGYDIYAVYPNDVQHVTNTNSTLYVGAGTQTINKTWYNYGGEYIVIGDIIVAVKNTYTTLTIQPGNKIKLDTTVQLQIGNYITYANNYGGEIIADGTPDSLIIFQARDMLTGDWDGINFHSNADNFGGNSSFKHCIIEGASTNNIYCNETNILNFEHVTFSNSKHTGIQLNNSSPYLKLCQAVNNDSIGIHLSGSSNPVIGDTLGWGCDIYGNGNFGIYNTTGILIHAKHNFWNSMDSTTIAGMVYDYYDNPSNGIVEFMPFAATSFFDNLPPDEFNLLSLTNNLATPDQTPSFTWEAPSEPDGDPVSYYFYYTDDITWTSNITVSEELTDPNYTIPETLTGGKYYWWKVKASDNYIATSSNQTWTFAVSLPPVVPEPIVPSNGSMLRENDFLVWNTTTDPDEGDYVSHYRLQLDDDSDFSSPEIDIDDIQLNGKGSSLSLQINELPGYLNLENRNYYWRISATDGFGIESAFSDGSDYFLYLLDVSAKVFLEGSFNGSEMNTILNDDGFLPLSQPYNIAPWNYMTFESVESMPANVVDWILFEIRSTTEDVFTATSDKIIYQKAAFVLVDGSIVNMDGSNIFEIPVSFDNNVYLVIHHRNHLSIISNFELSADQGFYHYDFTTGSDKVYGGTDGYSQISPGIWGMSGGDANSDGFINMIDKDSEWAENAGKTNYIYPDMNMDGQVDNSDKNDILLTNDGKGTQVPD